MTCRAGEYSQDTLDYLLKRRSVTAQNLSAPGPDEQVLSRILTAAMRVPDHGKLCPWYFIVLQGEQRAQASQKIKTLYQADNPNAKDAHVKIEGQRLMRAPVVVAVVSRMRTGKPPMWEQVLSSGAVCMNMVMAANAAGFGAQWLTEWYAYDQRFKGYLGLDDIDNIAGFIHIGTPEDIPDDRPRPNMDDLVTFWQEGCTLKKGEGYASPKFDLPVHGFSLPERDT